MFKDNGIMMRSFHISPQKGNQNIVKLLIETRGQSGKNILHVAVESGKYY